MFCFRDFQDADSSADEEASDWVPGSEDSATSDSDTANRPQITDERVENSDDSCNSVEFPVTAE